MAPTVSRSATSKVVRIVPATRRCTVTSWNRNGRSHRVATSSTAMSNADVAQAVKRGARGSRRTTPAARTRDGDQRLTCRLSEPGFVEEVVALLETARLDSGTMTFEIAETRLVDDSERTAARPQALRPLGVRIACHDDRTGHAAKGSCASSRSTSPGSTGTSPLRSRATGAARRTVPVLRRRGRLRVRTSRGCARRRPSRGRSRGPGPPWRPRSGDRRPHRAGGGRPPRCWRCRWRRSGGPSTPDRPTR